MNRRNPFPFRTEAPPRLRNWPAQSIAAGVFAALSLAPAGAAPAGAAQNEVPIAQYWMDLATFNLMGMDEMPDMQGIPGGLLGGMMGRSSAMGRDGRHARGVGNFGQTKVQTIGRQIDIALHTRERPAGTSAVQQVPGGADLGAEPLHLVTPPREGGQRGTDEPDYPEPPRGRILFYWGCSETVKPGQPRVMDMANFSASDYAGFMQGRSVRDRGARAEPGHAIWPNERENSRIQRQSTLVGEHAVAGEGVPDGLRFRIDAAHDFMPSLQVSSSGDPRQSVRVRWQPLASARAYLVTAISGGMDGDSVPEMVIWSSSEPPESGMGLLDYASNANIDQWLRERVLLPPTQSECAIPEGIFAGREGTMLQTIAYGNELNLVHPPRPTDPKAVWNPQWSVRVRNKSLAMNLLGEDPMQMPDGEDERGSAPARQEKTGMRRLFRGILGR